MKELETYHYSGENILIKKFIMVMKAQGAQQTQSKIPIHAFKKDFKRALVHHITSK